MAEQQTINKVNGIDMDVLQGTVSAIQQEPELGKCKFRVSNKWLSGNHNCSTITDFYGAKQENSHKQPFELHADEPPILAGEDQGANPVEHLNGFETQLAEVDPHRDLLAGDDATDSTLVEQLEFAVRPVYQILLE